MQLTPDYAERVYAGVLGKVIGVYLGRPFEGWTYDMIQARLGDIEYYVHDKLDVPLIVTDDDISGTFTFVRALEDHGNRADLTAKEIGDSWLNYLIKERTILWWGGLGNSTEHTAYLRLANGIPAPQSGSMALNGKVVSEQIGAQIFIDGWAMVCPGDPTQAVRFADAAARVSHDGEAVYGARMMAAMEAIAFVEGDTNKIIDGALEFIPSDSVIATMINDIRDWHAREKDWRATREQIEALYGYDKYGGNCHMVPNHGLIIHSLLHGEGDFSETMKIINTSGWDTDCNSGNVGCLMGIKGGLGGIDAGLNKGLDWRGPVADRVYIPTADGGRAISDCAAEAVHIVNMARRLADKPTWAPKQGAQFHFAFPGALQGFAVTDGNAEVRNEPADGEFSLLITTADQASVGTPVFTPSKATAKYFEKRGYALMASPRIFPGQQVTANIHWRTNTAIRLYLKYYGDNDEVGIATGDAITGRDGDIKAVYMTVPQVGGPIFEVGVELEGDAGSVLLHSLSWGGAPTVEFNKPTHTGSMWRRAWVNGVDQLTSWTHMSEMLRLVQNEGFGMAMQGTNEWQDYEASAQVRPHMAKRAGIAVRVQGLTRGYALLLAPNGEVQLVRRNHQEQVLATAPLDWQLGQTYDMSLNCQGNQITGFVDGVELVSAQDDALNAGAMGLIAEEGRVEILSARVCPALTRSKN